MGWFCIAAFAVYGFMLYRKYYSMAVFGIISLLVPLTSHVMSTCRFIIGTYVIFIGAYDLMNNAGARKFPGTGDCGAAEAPASGAVCWSRRRKTVNTLILTAFIIVEGILLILWYNSDCWLM